MVCDGVPEAQHMVAHCTHEVSVREFMSHAHLGGTAAADPDMTLT
jgi:hypothetical protein